MRVGIVGAGIGGLAAAIALAATGWEVSVFEGEDGLSGVGTALGLWPAALRALDALGSGSGSGIGLGKEVRRLATPQVAAEFRRPDGSRIATMNVTALERRTGDPVYLLSRPALL